MEKKTTKEIVEMIRRGSRFTYKDDIRYRKASFIAPFNIDRVEYAVFQGHVRPEDFHLMEIVYDSCFVTPEFLLFRIKAGASKGDRGCIQISKSGLLDSLGKLNERMEFLATLGYFFCFESADSESGKISRIYYCSMEGFRAFTHRLEKRMSYNRTLVYRPMHEVFRFLATNMALYAFYRNPYFVKLSAFEQFELRMQGEKRFTLEDVYGRVIFQKPESNHRVHVVIEPIFFRFDPKCITEEMHMERIMERLDTVKKIATCLNEAEDSEAYVLFLLEDGVGVRKLQDLIATLDIQFFVERCFYTSENVLFDASVNGEDGTDSLLGLAVKDGELRFKQRDLPGTF